MDPNAFAKTMEDAGQVPAMVGEVARRKALIEVLSKAKITDRAGTPVDLKSLFTSPEASSEEAPAGPATPASEDPSAVSVPVFDLPPAADGQ